MGIHKQAMSISQLFLQSIPHVVETILGYLTVRELSRCRRVGMLWLIFIDNNTKLSRRLIWMYSHLGSLNPVQLICTNTCVDDDIIVIDQHVDIGDREDEEKVRKIDVFSTHDFCHIYHIGYFTDPSFHCLSKMKMVNKMLIVFTTSNYDDKLLTYKLTKPASPEAGNFRPAGRLPLICADADDKYDLSVYSFSPKIINLNSLKTGLLVKRIPLKEMSMIVAVKIGWPRCFAITAFEQISQAVQSNILCFNLVTGSLLYKIDTGNHLVLLGHMVCEGHSQIHILDDYTIISLITEEGISLRIWTHEFEENVLSFERPHGQVELDMERYIDSPISPVFKLPSKSCQGKAGMVLNWDQLKCYQPKRLKQKLAQQNLQTQVDQKWRNSCNLSINILDF